MPPNDDDEKNKGTTPPQKKMTLSIYLFNDDGFIEIKYLNVSVVIGL